MSDKIPFLCQLYFHKWIYNEDKTYRECKHCLKSQELSDTLEDQAFFTGPHWEDVD